MVSFADEALLMQTFVDQKLAYAEEIRTLLRRAGKRHFFPLVIVEAFDGSRLFSARCARRAFSISSCGRARRRPVSPQCAQ